MLTIKTLATLKGVSSSGTKAQKLIDKLRGQSRAWENFGGPSKAEKTIAKLRKQKKDWKGF